MGELARFLEAQDRDGTFAQAMSELREGTKRGHWMWFVFPQLAGLGQSEMSRRYAIASLEEAREYLADAVLGWRLREAAAALLEHAARSAEQILGRLDAIKLRSSMTLFAAADPEELVLARVLAEFYDGEPDEATQRLLGG